MGDPITRKSAAVNRLRNNLRKKKESLADQFDFRMYIMFHFKDKKKKPTLFEVDEVMPVMTNNYEHSILKGVENNSYSYESSKELIDKDVVQFHAHKWLPLRRDVMGGKNLVDFFLWPRNDIEHIECHLFSRWKGGDEPFRPLDTTYTFLSNDYEFQLTKLVSSKDKAGLIVTDREQAIFLFVDKHQIQSSTNSVTMFKLRSVCLYMPQDQLMSWKTGTVEDLVAEHFLALQ